MASPNYAPCIDKRATFGQLRKLLGNLIKIGGKINFLAAGCNRTWRVQIMPPCIDKRATLRQLRKLLGNLIKIGGKIKINFLAARE